MELEDMVKQAIEEKKDAVFDVCGQIENCKVCQDMFHMKRNPRCCINSCGRYKFCKNCPDGVHHLKYEEKVREFREQKKNT
jgi:hypothetical protein